MLPPTKQRKYYKIWKLLRRNFACNVQVNRLIAARVIKAVVKEKYMDTIYRMINPIDTPRLDIKQIPLSDKVHVRIEFRLRQRYGLVDIKTTIEEIQL